jgi:hypothetical protein
MRYWVGIWVCLWLLAGCAAPSVQLQLSPASLGRAVQMQQQLLVSAGGRSQALETMLEVDPQELRLAVLGLNQTVLRLTWDGSVLQQTRASWLPEVVRGETILSDLQLVWWPADVVRAALPAGWTLESSAAQRRLLWQGQEMVNVAYRGSQHVDVVHRRLGYQLQIDSLEQAP